jgi:CubicO group peptidase (beta-lactamase class C family)
MDIGGTVDPGFEQVREVFERSLAEGNEIGAACAAVVDNKLVVDLWAGLADPKTKQRWESDTVVNVFSTTKGMASMAILHAASKGRFGFEDRVVEHWPEFAAGGKEDVTIRQLLSHQAGLCAIDQKLHAETLADPNRMASALAAQAPAWEPGTRHGYHGISLGWYESELIRRTDPSGRTIGRYFDEEIATPLDLDFWIGLPDSVPEARIARVHGDWYRVRMLGNVSKMPSEFVRAFLNPRSLTARTFGNPAMLGKPARYNDPAMRRLELPASNGHGTARAVATAYGALAAGGERLGITNAVLDEVSAPAADPDHGRFDAVLRTETQYSLGYCKPWGGFEFGTSTAFGTPGAGGSFGFADPARRLGFAYVMNRMDYYLWNDPREQALRDAVIAGVGRQ